MKEYYFYLDSTPTHSYMKYLYKYPQAAFPYDALVDENRRRDRRAPEFELIDTGVFDTDRYFDVVVEYAKAAPDDVLVRITATNRGPEAAELHLLPTLWYRNTWSWDVPEPERPSLRVGEGGGHAVIEGEHATLGARWLYCDGSPELLFTDNDTNARRLYHLPNPQPWVKDSINDYVVGGQKDAVNPERVGTKAAAHYRATLAPGQSVVTRLRLSNSPIPGGPSQRPPTPHAQAALPTVGSPCRRREPGRDLPEQPDHRHTECRLAPVGRRAEPQVVLEELVRRCRPAGQPKRVEWQVR